MLQDQLFYYGIVLDNKVESNIINNLRSKKIGLQMIENHFSKLPTPFKSGKVLHYNIRLSNLIEEQKEDLYKTISGGVRKYVDNTIDIYDLMNKKSS